MQLLLAARHGLLPRKVVCMLKEAMSAWLCQKSGHRCRKHMLPSFACPSVGSEGLLHVDHKPVRRLHGAELVSSALQDILRRTTVKTGSIAGFVELHIEQGPLLEKEQLKLGVVTAIAAPAAVRVKFQGDGGHAGALLMPDR